jgi:cyclopropane fatty-acyl-phospholipid synthase-like methyltransferase
MKNLKNKDLVEEELERLGYWQGLYSVPNFFGEGPTKLAMTSYEVMLKNNTKKILELGCGQGRDCIFFAEKNFMVTASDLSPEAIDFVKKTSEEKKLTNLNAFVQDLKEDFQFTEKFDCIYSNLVFQFFNEKGLADIIRKVSLCLKENGLFIFSTKKPGDKYYKVGEKISENAYKTKGVVRYFFEKEVIQDLVQKEFKIENFENESHVNLDKTISSWWYLISRKL